MATEPWSSETAPDWQPVADLCESVVADLPTVIPGIVDRIRQDIPDYRVVDRREQERDVTEHYRGLLIGLATQRPPNRAEIESARKLGAERARTGLPLQALVDAYHVGYREVWNVLLTRAQSRTAEPSAHLVRIVGLVWTWVQQASSAAADAYGAAVRVADAALLSVTHQFVDALSTGPRVTVDLTALSHALTFDPDKNFQVLCSPAADWPDDRLIELRGSLRSQRGTARCVNRGQHMIVLMQHISADIVMRAMRRQVADAAIGVGMVRAGLSGAAASIVDAREALALANHGQTVTFPDQWLLATVLPRADRFASILESCRVVARTHPDLAETIRVFADNGFSLTATARVLHIHPNTVKYRLNRWQELAGRDIHTWQGLSDSMIALSMPAPSQS